MAKRITQEEFENLVAENNQYTRVTGEYIGMREKIECKCLICGEKYFANAQDVKKGKIHNQCAHKIVTQKNTKTLNIFKEELKKVIPYISVIGNYINSKTNILCLCNIHNEYFNSTPDHLLSGKCGCKLCKSTKISNALRKSEDEFIDDVQNNTVDIIGKYLGTHQKIKAKCKTCGFEWEPIAGSLIKGSGCPHCVGRHKTTEEFVNEINKYNPYVTVIGEYINSNENIKCKCNICGYIWDANPSRLKISGCPKCCLSHGEKRIMNYLNENNIQFTPQKKFDNLLGIGGRKLSYDFCIDNRNILIEYQGEFHDGTAFQQTEEDFKKQIIHDRRKREYAKNNNYKLIEIWYYDFYNIENILERELR